MISISFFIIFVYVIEFSLKKYTHTVEKLLRLNDCCLIDVKQMSVIETNKPKWFIFAKYHRKSDGDVFLISSNKWKTSVLQSRDYWILFIVSITLYQCEITHAITVLMAI